MTRIIRLIRHLEDPDEVLHLPSRDLLESSREDLEGALREAQARSGQLLPHFAD